MSTNNSTNNSRLATNGQLLIGSTGATPVVATITQGSGVTVTNGAGTITIAATGSGGTVTSVATGIGLSGGTITTTGTVRQAIPQAAYGYASGDTTVNAGATTKIALAATRYNYGSAFDTANSKFLPTVAGLYQVNVCARVDNPTALGVYQIDIYKNGSRYSSGQQLQNASTQPCHIIGSTTVDMNGSTDYIEMYVINSGAGSITVTDAGTSGQVTFLTATFMGPNA